MKRLLLAPLLIAISSPCLADYYSNEIDPMTDQRKIGAGIYSNDSTDETLQVLCLGGDVTAGLTSENVLNGRSVTVRWDNEKPINYFWDIGSNQTTFFMGFSGFTGRKQANRYVKKFREHSSMLVRFGTYLYGTKTVRFDLEKFHPLLDRAEAEGCAF